MAKYETPESFEMSKVCKHVDRRTKIVCGGKRGHVVASGMQDCVYCDDCGTHVYNQSRIEAGKKPRSVSSVHELLSPKRKAAVRLRANGRCEVCGKGPEHGEMHVGHIISVKSAMDLGMADEEINSQENLMCLCAECNLGLSDEPIPLRMMLRVIRSRLSYERVEA